MKKSLLLLALFNINLSAVEFVNRSNDTVSFEIHHIAKVPYGLEFGTHYTFKDKKECSHIKPNHSCEVEIGELEKVIITSGQKVK